VTLQKFPTERFHLRGLGVDSFAEPANRHDDRVETGYESFVLRVRSTRAERVLFGHVALFSA
jgi:hypothetical protein